MTRKLILASGSPRRTELLKRLVSEFEVCPSDVEEIIPKNTTPVEAVEFLAILKATDICKKFPNDIVIGADTVVDFAGQILGKPKNAADAKQMLQMLSGKTHWAHTGVAIIKDGKTHAFSESCEVHFATLTEAEIDAYIQTGEPNDKAGAYGIQGYGSRFVEKINGDFFTVMGFPIAKIYQMFKQLEIC